MLEVRDLHAFYGKSHILHGVHLDVGRGEIVSLLGRNGVGRSTTIKAIMGMVDATGSVKFKGEELVGLKTFQVAHKGLGYVPENRDIFPTLTVTAEPGARHERRRRTRPLEHGGPVPACSRGLPSADAQAGVLSGGEQQMLTLCRTLMGDPELVMIDEPTEGLAPEDRRAGRRAVRGNQEPRRVDPAGRAEARDRARHLRAALRDGPRPDRVRGHAAGAARK